MGNNICMFNGDSKPSLKVCVRYPIHMLIVYKVLQRKGTLLVICGLVNVCGSTCAQRGYLVIIIWNDSSKYYIDHAQECFSVLIAPNVVKGVSGVNNLTVQKNWRVWDVYLGDLLHYHHRTQHCWITL